MNLTDKDLKPSSTVFHGVVPGKSAYPVGKIALEVAFGNEHDYRVETLNLVGRLMPSLWRDRVMCICSLRCRVAKEPSQHMVTGR